MNIIPVIKLYEYFNNKTEEINELIKNLKLKIKGKVINKYSNNKIKIIDLNDNNNKIFMICNSNNILNINDIIICEGNIKYQLDNYLRYEPIFYITNIITEEQYLKSELTNLFEMKFSDNYKSNLKNILNLNSIFNSNIYIKLFIQKKEDIKKCINNSYKFNIYENNKYLTSFYNKYPKIIIGDYNYYCNGYLQINYYKYYIQIQLSIYNIINKKINNNNKYYNSKYNINYNSNSDYETDSDYESESDYESNSDYEYKYKYKYK